MKKITLIFLIIIFTSCEGITKTQNAKALESISNYTKDEFFKHNYNIEIVDFNIKSIKEVKPDSIIVKFIEAEIYEIAFKIADPSIKKNSDLDLSKLNSEVFEKAYKSAELKEYSKNLKKYSHNKQFYLIDVDCKFTAKEINTNFQNNLLWPKMSFLLSEDFIVIDAPKMFPN